jgi:membrane protease YdiL (CAAX protease family)
VILTGYAVVGFVTLALVSVLGRPDGLVPDSALPVQGTSGTATNLVLSVSFFALIAPLAEESLFRGWYQARITNLLPTWAVVVLSAGAFAALHMQHWHSPAWVINPFALGLVCSMAVVGTGSLAVPWAIHAAWNGTVLWHSHRLVELADASAILRAWTATAALLALVLVSVWVHGRWRRNVALPGSTPAVGSEGASG